MKRTRETEGVDGCVEGAGARVEGAGAGVDGAGVSVSGSTHSGQYALATVPFTLNELTKKSTGTDLAVVDMTAPVLSTFIFSVFLSGTLHSCVP
jgi:hypothetical protein